jgi:hypothetical protein
MYYSGIHVPSDTSAAKTHFLAAAVLGHPEAMRYMCKVFREEGATVEAIRWLGRASKSGEVGAMQELKQLMEEIFGADDEFQQMDDKILLELRSAIDITSNDSLWGIFATEAEISLAKQILLRKKSKKTFL